MRAVEDRHRSRRLASLPWWLAVAALLAGAAAAPPSEAPSATIAPPAAAAAASPAPTATATAPAPERDPAALLARFKEVTGGAAWDRIRVLRTTGSVHVGGLEGTFETVEEIGTGRGKSRFDLGPMSGAIGFDGTTPWSQDGSGEVTLQRGEEALEAARNDAYRTSLAWWFPERWPAALRALPDREQDGRRFAIVEITPRGGRPFELWLDVETGLPERAVEHGGVETIVTTLGDWRTVETTPPGSATPAPVRLPFHQRANTGEAKYDLVAQATAVEVDPPLAADAFAPPQRRAADFALPAGAASITVPFTLRNNHVYLRVSLDGRRPRPMLFDSGGFNVVTPATAARLGLETEGALQARGVGEGSEDLGVTHVAKLELGGAVLRDQVFYVLPLAGIAELDDEEVAGVLGFEVLQRFVVEIDYARRRVTLTLPERFDPTGAGEPVPFVFAGHVPAVDGEIDGIAGRFTIDTGSRSQLSIHRPFVEKHGLVERYGAEIEAVTGWGVGGGVSAKLARGGTLMLGRVPVRGPTLELVTSEKGAFADRYLAGNVGGGILRHFRVTFDYRRERLYLAATRDADADVFDRAGLWLVERGKRLVVEDIVPGAPAAAAGVMPGDVIEALDGEPVRKLGAEAVRSRLLHDPPGTNVRLRVRGTNGARDVEIVLHELPTMREAEAALP